MRSQQLGPVTSSLFDDGISLQVEPTENFRRRRVGVSRLTRAPICGERTDTARVARCRGPLSVRSGHPAPVRRPKLRPLFLRKRTSGAQRSKYVA